VECKFVFVSVLNSINCWLPGAAASVLVLINKLLYTRTTYYLDEYVTNHLRQLSLLSLRGR